MESVWYIYIIISTGNDAVGLVVSWYMYSDHELLPQCTDFLPLGRNDNDDGVLA